MKQLLVFDLDLRAETYNALDASDRRIVAERLGEVKVILSTDYTDYRRNLWLLVLR